MVSFPISGKEISTLTIKRFFLHSSWNIWICPNLKNYYFLLRCPTFFSALIPLDRFNNPTIIQDPLTLSWMFCEVSSSAFFSREDTHNFRFWRQREAAARLRSRKRCRRSSGSSSTVRLRRPPVLGVGWAGETCRSGRKRHYLKEW